MINLNWESLVFQHLKKIMHEFENSSPEMILTYCVMRLERRTAWNSEAREQHTQYASPVSNYTTRTVPQSQPTDHRIDRTVDQNTMNLYMKFVQKLSLFTVSWFVDC